MTFYRLFFRRRALPVTVHMGRDVRFSWRAILGAQIGPWFIGAIKGSTVDLDAGGAQ